MDQISTGKIRNWVVTKEVEDLVEPRARMIWSSTNQLMWGWYDWMVWNQVEEEMKSPICLKDPRSNCQCHWCGKYPYLHLNNYWVGQFSPKRNKVVRWWWKVDWHQLQLKYCRSQWAVSLGDVDEDIERQMYTVKPSGPEFHSMRCPSELQISWGVRAQWLL